MLKVIQEIRHQGPSFQSFDQAISKIECHQDDSGLSSISAFLSAPLTMSRTECLRLPPNFSLIISAL